MASSTWVLVFITLLSSQQMRCLADCERQSEESLFTWGQQKCEQVKKSDETSYLDFGLKTAAIAGSVIVGAPIVASLAGFGAAGIAAGSLAATYQSAMIGGSIASGSLFAGLQSLGAAGIGVAGKAAIVATSGAAVKLYDSVMGNKDRNKDANDKN